MKMNSSLARITISNAQLYGYHGVKEEERTLGGKYEIDADVYYDARTAALSDNVASAVNYEEVMYAIAETFDGENYSLIETLAYEILNTLMDRFPLVVEATIRIRKMSTPIRQVLDYVEVEQSMSRE